MKTITFKNKEECISYYLKRKGERIDFTTEEMKEFLTFSTDKETVKEKLPENDKDLPSYIVFCDVTTYDFGNEVSIDFYFPEYATLPYKWNAHYITFEEQKDGMYKCRVPKSVYNKLTKNK